LRYRPRSGAAGKPSAACPHRGLRLGNPTLRQGNAVVASYAAGYDLGPRFHPYDVSEATETARLAQTDARTAPYQQKSAPLWLLLFGPRLPPAPLPRNLPPPQGTIMRIEIICTGDEVLTGKITNTNFSYMAQKLEDAGLSVHWGTTVGDDRESLLAAFQLASTRADAVIVNGGLGPTVDDLSQEIAARAAGVELVLHEAWLARMEDFFARRTRTMPPNNVKQAMLPATAEMIDNPIGTACGFALDIGRARFFFTPGVPRLSPK
jgi:molybdenum cofactor synthesis domain-containing protein